MSDGHFTVLILDNEVTVGHFVATPPYPWTRLIHHGVNYQSAPGYPVPLTAGQAKFEMRNWDAVALDVVADALQTLDASVDCVLIGNNAGQGRPLARSLPKELAREHGAIIYGTSLPEKEAYAAMGYRNFFSRSASVPRIVHLAREAGRPPALFFINTIQHNESNYHDP